MMLVILVAVVSVMITSVVMYKKLGGTSPQYVIVKGEESEQITNVLNGFRKIIDEKFLGEVKEEDLLNGAIKGYIEGLNDPYTEYYTKEEMEEVAVTTYGNFDGIGIYMTKDKETDCVLVLAPIEESPAEKAGILPGDIITKVDDEDCVGKELDVVSTKIKGDKGTKVKLEIVRGSETKTFEVERQNIKVNHVKAEVLENQVGYIKLSTFDSGCAEEFKSKYEELQQKGINSLVIDVRNNGGGIVDEALEILDLMVNKGDTTLITVDKKNNEKVTKSKTDPEINVPIVVLTNENTASASEILAGALKDLGKAKIVGEKTYGKGVIQELITLSNGAGIKITTSEYYTPNRNKINTLGIEPDEKVELPEEAKQSLTIEKTQDTQLQKALELLK